mmetsp:Transcript_8162/g.15991  ORF Transcript_8162/g.15991 Transcript_8162/m.15991 type:complete len:200 (-) Transcript_8162:218-817(-)
MTKSSTRTWRARSPRTRPRRSGTQPRSRPSPTYGRACSSRAPPTTRTSSCATRGGWPTRACRTCRRRRGRCIRCRWCARRTTPRCRGRMPWPRRGPMHRPCGSRGSRQRSLPRTGSRPRRCKGGRKRSSKRPSSAMLPSARRTNTRSRRCASSVRCTSRCRRRQTAPRSSRTGPPRGRLRCAPCTHSRSAARGRRPSRR